MFKLITQRFYVRWLLIFCLFALIFGSIVQAAETKKLIDLDFKAADIKDILRALAATAGVTFIIDPDVTGTVTLSLNKKTFTEALNIIAKQFNLAVTKEENVYHISQIDTSFLKIEYENGELSVEARGAKLITLFDTITQKTGRNLVLDPTIMDRGSIILNKAPLEDAIKALLTHFNLVEVKAGSVSRIERKSSLDILGNTAKIEYQNGRLTIDAKNVPLQSLTRAITEKTGVSIVPDINLNPNVSIFVQNLAIGDVLNALCDTNNLGLSQDGPVWRIYKLNNSFRVSYINNTLSVDADGADAEGLFAEISRKSGVQITLDRDLRAQITIHFKNVPFFQGISSIADSAGWIIEKRGPAYQLHQNTNNNPNIRIYYNPESKLFDIDVTSASIAQVISEIAKKADLNISVTSQVNWPVNAVRLMGVNVYQAFDFLLKGTIFSYIEEDGVFNFSDSMYPRPETVDFQEIEIYPLKYLKAEQVLNTLPQIFPRQNFVVLPEKNAFIVTAPGNLHVLFKEYINKIDIERIEDQTEVFPIKHLKAEDVLKYLPASIPKQDIVVIKEMNALTVSGPKSLMYQIRQYIEKIDQPNPMIIFDIKVIKINNSTALDWQPPTVNNLTVDLKGGSLPLNVSNVGAITALNTLITRGKAQILTNPIMATLNGCPTSFTASNKRYYKIPQIGTSGASGTPTPTASPESNYKAFDNTLKVTITPWVSANNQITMEIKPTITEYGPVSDSGLPDTSEHTSETMVRVSNNQTVVISGLKTTRKEKSVSKIPFFGDIPLLGFFFRTTKDIDVQDEFVIVITPTLSYDDISRVNVNQELENKLEQALQSIDLTSTTIPTPSSTVNSPAVMPDLTSTVTPDPQSKEASTPWPTVTPTPTPKRALTSSGLNMAFKNRRLKSAGPYSTGLKSSRYPCNAR
ncbi:MAG: hypothetical protein K6U80_10785 [Firmicutes bacterium]|nr:hypothetical protein [Bacillota bacterium]